MKGKIASLLPIFWPTSIFNIFFFNLVYYLSPFIFLKKYYLHHKSWFFYKYSGLTCATCGKAVCHTESCQYKSDCIHLVYLLCLGRSCRDCKWCSAGWYKLSSYIYSTSIYTRADDVRWIVSSVGHTDLLYAYAYH